MSMSEKTNLQMGHVTPAEWRPTAEAAFNAIEAQRLRAEAWKAMAERLYKSALCDCTESNTVCDRCQRTIQVYANLLSDDKNAKRDA